jgi:hypothetical protein
MTPELKRCPFCGGEAEYEEVKDGGGLAWWTVGCKLKVSEHDEDDSCCGYQSTKVYARKSEAATAWNKRYSGLETSPEPCEHTWVLSNFDKPRCLVCHMEKPQ